MQSSNLLKYAKHIKNISFCKYDTNFGYTTNWSVNTDVDGWDIYNNIYFYGCWSGVLFGSSYGKECYIQRTYQFLGLSAEDYYTINVMMRIIPKDGQPTPKRGKIRWLTTNDTLWDSNKEMYFDLTASTDWYMYIITAGESKWYQGDITNLRIYPFVDGHKGCKFELKYARIEALDKYICNNTQCSHYTIYEHPCPWTGSYGSCTSLTRRETYTTVADVSDSLIVDMSDYGEEVIALGSNSNMLGNDMAKLLATRLNDIGLGAYYYATVEYTQDGRIKISGGDVGSTVRVVGGTASEMLGFFDSTGFVGILADGNMPATGFDYASTRRLNNIELDQLIAGGNDLAYYHNPEQYSVEAGRADFFNSLTSNSKDYAGLAEFFYNIKAPGVTIIDVTHPFNDSGKISDIYVNCSKIRDDGAKVYVLRPLKDGTFKVIHTFYLYPEDQNHMWTVSHTSHHISCDALVSKGDVMAFYNTDLHCVVSHASTLINAKYFYHRGDIASVFYPGSVIANGVIGFSWYARSRYRQISTVLEIDFGKRVNVGTLSFTGSEIDSYFNYNIASCLDMQWEVDLHGENHVHTMTWCSDGIKYTVIHQNLAYGVECLSDGILSPDGGRQGDTYGVGANGISTIGDHAYFYVNGDGEWDYQYECDGRHEFCYPYCGHNNTGFEKDPISFIMRFPEGVSEEVHRTTMYFKESNNFKHFSLSYYIGNERARLTGEAIGYHYVPSYNSVELDGSLLTYENADGIDGHQQFQYYLFSNPTPWINVNWDAQGGGELDSFLNYHSVASLQWNLLAHNFEPIRCNGFKIFCDHHFSTKLSEMELYVRTEAKASLVDNAVLKVSDYGDRWRYVPFTIDSLNTNTIIAKVDSSPRYAILDINSQLPFKAYSLHVETSNSNVFESCSNSLNIQNVNPSGFSSVNTFELENVYGVPCNLSVSIDKEIVEGDRTISHIICHSQEDLDDALVGPGAMLYKQADFPIYLGEGNVANNCKVYGLKNLIDGKSAYSLKNNLNVWSEFGTLHHNQIINFESQLNYNEVNFMFPEGVAQFFRLDLTSGLPDSSKFSYNINQIYAFSEGRRLDNVTLYLDANPGSDTHKGFETSIVNGVPQQSTIFEYSFDKSGFEDTWEYSITPPDRIFSALLVSDRKLYCDSIETGVTLEAVYTLPDEFGPLNYDVEFTFGTAHTLSSNIDFYVDFIDSDGVWFHRMSSIYNDTYIRFYYSSNSPVNVLNKTKTNSTSAVEYAIKVSKRFVNETFYIDNGSASTAYGTNRRLKKIRFMFYNGGFPVANKRYLYVSDVKISVFPEISYLSSVVLEVPDNLLDSIVVCTEDGAMSGLALYVADVSGDFRLHSTNFERSDAVPVVTSDYHKRAYDHTAGTNAYKFFNRSWTTSYVTYPTTTSDRWVGYDLGDCSLAINHLGSYQLGPVTMYFQGSNDPTSVWESKLWNNLLIYSQSDAVTTEYYDVPNSVRYRYYRTVAPHVSENYNLAWGAVELAMKLKFGSQFVTATLWNNPVRFYLAVDLGRRYNIDIIRHYGSTSTHETGIGSTYISYSDSNTSDIGQVQWDNGNILILIHFDELSASRLTESARKFDVPVIGDFRIDNSIAVFGWSAVFNGTNTLAYVNDLGSLVLHTYDFTMDFRVWLYNLPSDNNEAVFVCKGKTATAQRAFSIGVSSSGYLFVKYLFTGNTTTVYNIHELVVSTWYHIAVVRWSIYMYLFVNGTPVYTWTKTDAVYNTSDYIHLGAQHVNTNSYTSYFNGRMDEFRFTQFDSSWRGTFSIPVAPYSDNVASNEDARWLKFRLDCGAVITRLAYIGVYPNTTVVYSPGGGLNCEWDYLGRDLCDYSVGEYNIIKHYATISGSSVFGNSYATNVAIAYEENRGMDNCWGFLSTDLNPSLYIELFEPRKISKIYIKHGTGNDEDGYYIKNFTITGAPTISGSFTTLVSVTNNTAYETLYEFDVTTVQVVRLNITSYVSGNLTVYEAETVPGQVVPDLIPVLADGGFVNEIRLLTSSAVYAITSENYPRICIDLEKQYNIVSRSVWAGPVTYPASYTPPWSAENSFFKYSAELVSNPSLVRFLSSPPTTTLFGNATSYINYNSDIFLINNGILLPKGVYEVRWESLGVTIVDKFKLVLTSGPYLIEMFPNTVNAAWTVQSTLVDIEETGYYVLEVKEHNHYDDVNWGVRNIYIYAASGVSRWVQVEMNAATEYYYIWQGGSPYSDTNRILRKILLFTDDRKLPPVQNSNWWISNVSTLTNDYVSARHDECTLDIYYPASTEMDWVLFLEGDHFGKDKFWLEQDLLCFDLYIDDINNLDISVGGFGFGNIDGKYPFSVIYNSSNENMTSKPIQPYRRGAYGWDLSRIELHSGWNNIRLRFVDWNATVPITIPGEDKIPKELNLRNYVFTSFGIFYRGKGEPLNLKLENIRIERNRFDTDVQFGKGVCIGYGEYMAISAPGLSLGQGSLELTLTMYNDSAGVNYFGDLVSRTILTMSNTNNDLLSLGITGGSWFEIAFGNSLKMLNKFGLMDGQNALESAYISYGEPFHLALSWSNDGSAFDNGDTIRLYIGGVLVARWQETWEFDDYRVPALILGGGTCATALGNSAEGSMIFEIIKLYNYCKESFDPGEALSEIADKYSPNDYIYISKDGMSFYDRNSLELPFNFVQVQPGEKIPLYIKTFKDAKGGNLKSVTGEIVAEWQVSV